MAAACILASMITVISLVCANSLTCEGSRALWAFARDRGLPFSSTFAKVEKKRSVPLNSIVLCCVVQMALISIYFGTFTGFNTVISIATEGFYCSYLIPLVARIWSRFDGHAKVLRGPYSLGKWGVWYNLIGAAYLLFASITFNFPSISPVDKDNMNYCSAAVGVIGLISAITWVLDGRKNFGGPDTGGILNATEADENNIPIGGAEGKAEKQAKV